MLAQGEIRESLQHSKDLAVSESDLLAAPSAAPAEAGPDPSPPLDPAVAALCTPISPLDPCGADLDREGDADYLNYFAQVEGILPTSFFSVEDGKPFDATAVDIEGQLAAIRPLLARTRDIRLLLVQARLLILNKDIAGFAVNLAATAQLLDQFWDAVHPRTDSGGQHGDPDARSAAISVLDLPTVVFALQYAPLFEARRIGPVTYRTWMVATGEVKPRAGDATVAAAAITEAISDADAAVLGAARKNVALLKTSLDRIRNAYAVHGGSAGLESCSALVGKMFAFIDPHASTTAAEAAEAAAAAADGGNESPAKKDGSKIAGPAPASIAEAKQALAAIEDYYNHSEPSSPTLPLVRQAHQLIGKSFLEIMTILVPSQVEKAAFQIGTDHGFELPLGKLSSLSAVAPSEAADANDGAGETTDRAQPEGVAGPRYRVDSRSQAVALLDLVQRYFRHTEPSSPVPMLCERARALAERDFMSVLRDVLPKSALKNFGSDK
jgi:type VI secretion system protein ImpA